MSAEAASFTARWPAGRYTCELTMQRPRPGALVSCVIEWSPSAPARLTDGELHEYRRGRDKALAEASAAMGINAAVLELAP